jgi:hypothetical protein
LIFRIMFMYHTLIGMPAMASSSYVGLAKLRPFREMLKALNEVKLNCVETETFHTQTHTQLKT